MKIDLALELLKVDMKSDVDLMKFNIKEEIEKNLIKPQIPSVGHNRDFQRFFQDFVAHLSKSNSFLEFKSKQVFRLILIMSFQNFL